MALLRRILGAARANPAVTVVAFVVLLASATASAAVVVATDDGDDAAPPSTTAAPTTTVPTTTTAAPTTTTSPPTTTAAPTTTSAPTTTRASGTRCLVRLHGKGGDGADTYTQNDGVKVLTPTGNAEGWNGRQWLYFPKPRYDQARAVVQQAIDKADCGEVIVNGFSNGAAFAGKLYCQGETFGGRVVGYVVDDPVPDEGVEGCKPPAGTDVTLYWTGALSSTAQPGWDCSEEDWTCEGGRTIGIDAYADELGASVKQSKYHDHNWYQEAPELSAW